MNVDDEKGVMGIEVVQRVSRGKPPCRFVYLAGLDLVEMDSPSETIHSVDYLAFPVTILTLLKSFHSTVLMETYGHQDCFAIV